MKVKSPYSTNKWGISNAWVITVVLMIVIISCNQGGQKHDEHQAGSSISLDRSLQHDSMPDMNNTAHKKMEDENANTADSSSHSAHNTSPDNVMHPDTTIAETYWNTLPTNHTVIARQKVVEPVFSNKNFTITGNGYISFDTRRNRTVPVRVGGRIEQLFVKYNYQYVRKGEKILELYSPELNTYIEEYLYVLKQTNDSILQNRAKQKLILLGLTSAQVRRIEQTARATLTIPIYSPFEGYVLFNPSASSGMGNTGNDPGKMGGSMGGANYSSPSFQGSVLSDNSIREGMYVSANQTLFWVNDFKEAWGIIAFTKENEKYIHKGQPVTINSELLLPDRPVHTSIQVIEQVYEGEQKFTQARVYIPNSSKVLKQNSLITATVSVPVKSLMVPATSVYYLGKTTIVWVQVGVSKEGSIVFQSRVVKTGYRNDDNVEILDGLAQNEKIAKDAGYLADREAIIQY